METLVERLEARSDLMSVNELAEIIGSHPQTIYKWTRQHKLPYVRVGDGTNRYGGHRHSRGDLALHGLAEEDRWRMGP
jgi:excisionase family DNA binding protein